MDELPGASAFDTAEVAKRRCAVNAHAWRLVGEWHRRARMTHSACAGDVYLLNPMGSGASLIFRLLPEAITIAMEEADVPPSQRASTRGIVKALHAIDADASNVELWADACFASGSGEESPDAWRDICPPGTRGCKCRRWFADYMGGAA